MLDRNGGFAQIPIPSPSCFPPLPLHHLAPPSFSSSTLSILIHPPPPPLPVYAFYLLILLILLLLLYYPLRRLFSILSPSISSPICTIKSLLPNNIVTSTSKKVQHLAIAPSTLNYNKTRNFVVASPLLDAALLVSST
ncbi:hypothetical protein IF2G_05249 [Cordyceps javanica]|nr:hypothetical protein IF2G_05249 [Cordyceps javanica]